MYSVDARRALASGSCSASSRASTHTRQAVRGVVTHKCFSMPHCTRWAAMASGPTIGRHMHTRSLHVCEANAASVEQPSTSGAPAAADPWAKCFELMERAETVEVLVTGYNRGGLIVQLEGLRGFIPYHQLNTGRLQKGHQGDFDFMIGTRLSARILLIDVQGTRKSLILSERQAAIGAAMQALEVGQVVRGVVARLEDYGVFLRLPEHPPVQGLVQLEELSWNKVLAPDSLLTPGQEVMAVVTEVNAGKCRLALSLKRLQADPLKQTVGSQEVDWQPAAEPLPEVARMMGLLQQQEGIASVTLRSQANAGAVTSQELEVWLTREEVEDGYNVVLRDGNLQQQLHLSTALPRQQVIALLQTLLRSPAGAPSTTSPASEAAASAPVPPAEPKDGQAPVPPAEPKDGQAPAPPS